jgi:hypothetical protein
MIEGILPMLLNILGKGISPQDFQQNYLNPVQ